jgi:hypothetical protein
LEKIQGPNERKQIIEHIDKIIDALDLKQEVKIESKKEKENTNDVVENSSTSIFGTLPIKNGLAQKNKNQANDGQPLKQSIFENQKRIKISELDPQARFYIQAQSSP